MSDVDALAHVASRSGAGGAEAAPAAEAGYTYPRITVVTPNLNQGKYLEACMVSVLGQGYPNLEYVVVDGGSRDGSVDIIRKYERSLHRWVSEPDGGQYHAVQKGFEGSSGEIMTWLNSDDKYHDGALFAMAEIFTRFPEVRWLTGLPTEYTEEGVTIHRLTIPWASWSRYRFLTWDFQFVQQESTCWRRSLWEEAGSQLDLALELAGDLELWARFFRHAKLHTTTSLIAGFRYRPDGQRSRAFRFEYMDECRRVIRRERGRYSLLGRLGLSALRLIGFPLGICFFLDLPVLRAPYRALFRIPATLTYNFELRRHVRSNRRVRLPPLLQEVPRFWMR
jgi:glycosyltransferase involved in cell wall biosynthesis